MGLVDSSHPGGVVTVSDLRIVPAIEMLRKEGPGTFVVRDSSSYRGSFGLALKVQEAPAAAQNTSGVCPSLSLLKACPRQQRLLGSSPSSAATRRVILGQSHHDPWERGLPEPPPAALQRWGSVRSSFHSQPELHSPPGAPRFPDLISWWEEEEEVPSPSPAALF